MISVPTLIDKRLRAVIPEKNVWREAWGWLLLATGVFVGISCYTFTPYDYVNGAVKAGPAVANLGGPWGAWTAAHILGRFGIVGMIWPLVFVIWGTLTATGFVLTPRPRRFLGFLALAADLAAYAEILLPRTGLSEPSFGFGGLLGQNLEIMLIPRMGFGGTMIALAAFGILALVLTGNFSVSRTAEFSQLGVYHVRRGGRKFWRKHILNEDGVRAAQARANAAAAAPVASPSGDSEIVVEPARKKGVRTPANVIPVAAAPVPASTLALYYDGPAHGKPEPSMFSGTKKAADRSADFAAISENLVQQLAEFKIMGEIKAVTQGPVVTTFEFKPAPGTKVSKISALGEDLARLLKAQSLRVIAPIPGKDTVGFEVPNEERAVIGFSDLVDSKEFRSAKRRLPIAMGVDIFGEPVVEDLAEMPHLLVAGSTGSGKSVFMNTLIGSLIARHSASTLRFVMIDPKMVEMAAYNGLPHMACPVITDPQNEAKAALSELVREMDDRYVRMRAVGARNIESFNEIIRTRKKGEFLEFEGRWTQMPYVVLIIDEMADMMMLLGREAEQPITRLAQKARACGIHMVIATQRPSADVVTGLIKANFPTRVAFRVLSGVDSRTILDSTGAETLLGKGDMLYMATGGQNRLHGAYLSESEVQAMVAVTKKKK